MRLGLDRSSFNDGLRAFGGISEEVAVAVRGLNEAKNNEDWGNLKSLERCEASRTPGIVPVNLRGDEGPAAAI